MNLLKLSFLSVVFLFIIISSIGILLPSTVLVSRATNILATKDSILGYIKNIEEWKEWIEGMQQTTVKIISPTCADLAGTTVLINFISDSLITSTWTSQKGNVQTSTIRIIGDSLQKITVVQWQFEQKLKWYPWERLGSMMNDNIMGNMMEKNLNNLKSIVEKK